MITNLAYGNYLMASCNCFTKTPEVKYHTEYCYYRLLKQAMAKPIWINVDDELPIIGEDIYATDGSSIEFGFRSAADTDRYKWFDFWFPVSFWMYEKDFPLPIIK